MAEADTIPPASTTQPPKARKWLRRLILWSGWIAAILFGIWGRSFLVIPLLWVRENVSDISGYALAAVGVFMTVVPRKAARIEDNPAYVRTAGIILFAIAVTGLWFGSKDKAEIRKQIAQLVSASTTQATAGDITNLKGEITSGFDRLAHALESL